MFCFKRYLKPWFAWSLLLAGRVYIVCVCLLLPRTEVGPSSVTHSAEGKSRPCFGCLKWYCWCALLIDTLNLSLWDRRHSEPIGLLLRCYKQKKEKQLMHLISVMKRGSLCWLRCDNVFFFICISLLFCLYSKSHHWVINFKQIQYDCHS